MRKSDQTTVRRFELALGRPATTGNQVRVLRNGDQIFPAMLRAIRGAERTIDLLTFVYWTGDISREFADALSRRAAASVRVRVLLDHVGARRMDEELIGQMLEAGCQVKWFRPVGEAELGEVGHRTHRKVLVCDDRVGFTGGVGIAEEWTGDARDASEWRDTHFEVRGPAVDGLRSAFLSNWVETAEPLFDDADRFDRPEPVGDSTVMVVSDDDKSGVSGTDLAFRLLLDSAQERVRVTTAYFTPDDELLELLERTVGRGVRIEVLVPGEHADKAFVRWAGESLYQRVLDAGVDLRTFDPAMLHAKIMIADDELAIVGSSNVNSRSTTHDDEVMLVLFDAQLVGELHRHFDDDRRRSTQLDPADWSERGLLRRVRESVAGLVDEAL